MPTAILFNGAAAYIAQEAGILDLLVSNTVAEDARLSIDDVTFVGGLSSGALMTFAFNAAFGEEPAKLSWQDFKNNTLFTMTTDKVYIDIEGDTHDTSPLSQLLAKITQDVGYTQIEHLPFDSAIVIRYPNLDPDNRKNYWLTNITEVAKVLPSGGTTVTNNIKSHQAKLELVSSLMCSTAIPVIFPSQELYYKDDANVSQPIKNNIGVAAKFIDGGVGDNMVFSTYQEFFKVYNQHFDKIYFISPNFTKKDDEILEQISLEKRNGVLEESSDTLLTMETWTINFLKDIQAYNSQVEGGNLATKIYYCKPEIEGYNPLDFSTELDQYNDTITWGQENPTKIAVNINSINFGS